MAFGTAFQVVSHDRDVTLLALSSSPSRSTFRLVLSLGHITRLVLRRTCWHHPGSQTKAWRVIPCASKCLSLLVIPSSLFMFHCACRLREGYLSMPWELFTTRSFSSISAPAA